MWLYVGIYVKKKPILKLNKINGMIINYNNKDNRTSCFRNVLLNNEVFDNNNNIVLCTITTKRWIYAFNIQLVSIN